MWIWIEILNASRTKSPCMLLVRSQSRQSTRLFFQSSELGQPPTHHPHAGECVSPLLVPGGGGEGSQFARGDRHCGTVGIYALCAFANLYLITKTRRYIIPPWLIGFLLHGTLPSQGSTVNTLSEVMFLRLEIYIKIAIWQMWSCWADLGTSHLPEDSL